MGIMCLSGAVLSKAGAGVSATITSGWGDDSEYEKWIGQAESTINAITRNNYSDSYAGLNDDVKKILEQVCADLAAINAITFDMSGYTSRIEAEDIINTLRDSALRGLSILRDQKVVDFINGA